MAYCTNCGKEMAAKKICEHCGVKKGKGHCFCQWCATELEPNAKECPNCHEPKKSGTKVGKIISSVIGILSCVMGIYTFKNSVVTGLCCVLFGLLLLPVVREFIKKFTHNNLTLRKKIKIIYIVTIIAISFIGIANIPESDTNYAEQHWNTLTAMSEKEKEEEFRKTVYAGVSFYLIWNYDVKANHNIDIATVRNNGDIYTAYGKVTVTDNYGDRYSGNFTAVYEFDSDTQTFKEESLEVDTLRKK